MGQSEPSKDTEVFEQIEQKFLEIYGEPKENELIQIMMAGVRQDSTGKGQSTLHRSFFERFIS